MDHTTFVSDSDSHSDQSTTDQQPAEAIPAGDDVSFQRNNIMQRPRDSSFESSAALPCQCPLLHCPTAIPRGGKNSTKHLISSLFPVIHCVQGDVLCCCCCPWMVHGKCPICDSCWVGLSGCLPPEEIDPRSFDRMT